MRLIVWMWTDIDIYATKLFWKIMHFLVYMYYTHPSYRTSVVGKNCVYYIRIFTVCLKMMLRHILGYILFVNLCLGFLST